MQTKPVMEIRHTQLQPEYIAALSNGHFPISNSVPVFSRYKLNRVEYQIFNLIGSTCQFKKQDGTSAFGSIYCFCLCNRQPIAIIATSPSVKDAFDGLSHASISKLNKYRLTNSCIFKVDKIISPINFQAIHVSSITMKCVHIPSQSYDYVVPLPNNVTFHRLSIEDN